MNNYKKKIELEIERCMKQYGLTEDDVSFGNSGQMKGYVMGLRKALMLYNADAGEAVTEESNNDEQKVISKRSTTRTRTSR